MRDPKSESKIKTLHPKVRDAFKSFIEEAEEGLNITLRIAQALRTIEEQDALYAQGRTKPGPIVTKAKGGRSYHNYGLAVDLVELKDGKLNWKFEYSKLLVYSKKYGMTWGGLFTTIHDEPHFELTFGNHWSKLLEKYRKRDFIPGTKYVNI